MSGLETVKSLSRAAAPEKESSRRARTEEKRLKLALGEKRTKPATNFKPPMSTNRRTTYRCESTLVGGSNRLNRSLPCQSSLRQAIDPTGTNARASCQNLGTDAAISTYFVGLILTKVRLQSPSPHPGGSIAAIQNVGWGALGLLANTTKGCVEQPAASLKL